MNRLVPINERSRRFESGRCWYLSSCFSMKFVCTQNYLDSHPKRLQWKDTEWFWNYAPKTPYTISQGKFKLLVNILSNTSNHNSQVIALVHLFGMKITNSTLDNKSPTLRNNCEILISKYFNSESPLWLVWINRFKLALEEVILTKQDPTFYFSQY